MKSLKMIKLSSVKLGTTQKIIGNSYLIGIVRMDLFSIK